MRRLILPPLALLALAACDNAAPDANAPAVEPAPEMPAPAPDAGPIIAGEIPSAIHGRWGMVPADCTSTRGDAKGLLTIDATTLKFYESVATLGAIAGATPTHILASFDFEGEGMTWQIPIDLAVEDGGATLIRREFGDEAAPGPFRYSKCP